MTGGRAERIQAIGDALDGRQLVWFGIRGVDAEALLAIPQFTACFAITAPLEAAKLEPSTALETATGFRVDLDAYDIDLDTDPAVNDFREAVLRSLARPSAVTTYRPSTFLSDLTFATRDSSKHLGLFKDRQLAFEHKPWVETELHDLGVRTIPWRYYPTQRRRRIQVGGTHGPVVLRPSRTSGGVGISVVHDHDELEDQWSVGPGQLMGVAPFLADALPLNVNACVFGPDAITIHPASVQLIGLPGWTDRRFGFCGNDFAAVADLPSAVLSEIDTTTRTIGRWLGAMGYRGVFGADYLLDGERLYFAEVNARLQGSSRMAAALAARADHVDLLLDHVSAFLGLDPTPSLTVADWVRELPAASQVIKHHLGDSPVTAGVPPIDRLPTGARLSLTPEPGVRIEPGAVAWCVEAPSRVTTTGFELDDHDIAELPVLFAPAEA
jgi:hypothetical protein